MLLFGKFLEHLINCLVHVDVPSIFEFNSDSWAFEQYFRFFFVN